jgi:DNA gyrase/topoisomerase IV subunit B
MKKSHNNKHHRFHVYDDSSDRQIKTLHDEIWFESVIESHIDFDSRTLRNRIELISNFSKSVKIDRFRKDQKAEKNASIFSRSLSIREIDEYVCEIQKFLQSMMKKIVLWTIFNRHVKFFWIKECDNAVKNIRRFKRR